MMRTIKFSHYYTKLNYEDVATLIGIRPILLQEQSHTFLAYDTDDGVYDLPSDGIFILLMFVGKKGTFFTTLRRHTQSKWNYYNALIGQDLNIEVKE